MLFYKRAIIFFLCVLAISINLISTAEAYSSKNSREILLMLNNDLSTEKTKKGEFFEAKFIEDLILENTTIIPCGSRAFGEVTKIQQAGKVKKNASITVSINEIKMPDNKILDISNEPISTTIYSPEAKKVKERLLERIPVSMASSGTSMILGSTSSLAKSAIWGISLGAGAVAALTSGIISPDKNKTRLQTSASRAFDTSPVGTLNNIVGEGSDINLKEGQFINLIIDEKAVNNLKEKIINI